MLCTVASMLTTTPRLSPLLGAMPSPASLSSPLGSTSATTAITLAVPMSRPTTRSLYSLDMCFLCSLSLLFLRVGNDRRHATQPQRIALVVSQVGALDRRHRAPVLARHRRHGAQEALCAGHHLIALPASEFEHGAGVELRPPAAATGQRELVDREVVGLEQ